MGIDAVMFVVPSREYTESEVRLLAHDLAEAFGTENFLIIRPDDDDTYSFGPQHALSLRLLDEWSEWDVSDDISAKQVIEVNLVHRYYGIGYERGPIWLYIAIAEWLEERVGGEIYYGGDTGGLEKFDTKKRREIWQHFVKYGHAPYYNYFNPRGVTPPVCEFCGAPMTVGGGGTESGKRYRFWNCHGCGASKKAYR